MRRIGGQTAVVVLMVVSAVAMIAGAVVLSRGGDGLRVAEASFVSRDPDAPTLSTNVANSPAVARNPRDGDNLVVAYRIDAPGYSAALRWSGDGGRTWTPTELPLPAGTPACSASPGGTPCPFAPDLAFAPDGTLYVAYVHLVGNGNRPDALWLSRSGDGGRSLSAPTRVAGPLTFGAKLALDPAGPVHLVWLQAQETTVGGFAEPYPSVVAAHSTDGGGTFSTPVTVSDPGRVRVTAGDAVVDSEGRLAVVYRDLKDDRRDFENLAGPAWEGATSLVFTRSTDGGATFSPGIEVDSEVTFTRRFLVFIPEAPSLAAGPDGRLYLAWSDGRNGSDDVLLRMSSDGGAVWSAPVRVNDNPVDDGTAQFLPAVAAGPGRGATVTFLDGRLDPEGRVLVDAFVATASGSDLGDLPSGGTGDPGPGDPDSGRFDNRRLSAQSFSSRVGPTFGAEYGTDFGTGLGIAGRGGDMTIAWVDTRLGSEASGNQEVAFAAVDVDPEGALGGKAWLLLPLALGVVGVVVVLARFRPRLVVTDD